MKKSTQLFFSLFALALLLTTYKIPLVSSQGVTIMAAKVSEALPVNDPSSPLWQKATAIEVPMSAQMIARPFLSEPHIKNLTVRALYNDEEVAFLAEWTDETKNESTVRVQDFRDAVAIQFPLTEALQPFFCMGQQGGDVNIWHWKADWQADIVARQDVDTVYPYMDADQYSFTEAPFDKTVSIAQYEDENYVPAMAAGNMLASPTYNSPVEDLLAGGFGSLTTQNLEGQNVAGFGVWADGQWQVVFSRQLASAEGEDVNFQDGQLYSIAFAAWDGENEERNGQKSTSQWLTFQLGETASTTGSSGSATSTDSSSSSTSDTTTSDSAEAIDNSEAIPFLLAPFAILIILGVAVSAVIWVLSKSAN